MAVWKFFTGLRCFLCATTVCPPYSGGTWQSDHHDILAHDHYMATTLFMRGLLDKLIWEDAERGISCSPLFLYSFWHVYASVDRHTAQAFMSAWMSWILIHFSHVIVSDAVVKPLCPWANHLCGCFVWAPAPFVCLVCCFFWRNASLAGGFAGRLAGLWCCLFWYDLPSTLDLGGPCTNWFFPAYAHVRTEPQCDIGHTRGKKKEGHYIFDCCTEILRSIP